MSRALCSSQPQPLTLLSRVTNSTRSARILAACVLLASVVWLAGCSGVAASAKATSGSPNAPPPSPSPTPAPTPSPTPTPSPSPDPSAALFLYMGTNVFTEQLTDVFQGFQIDRQTGALGVIPNSPFQMPPNMIRIFPVAQSHYLFFVNFPFCQTPPGSPECQRQFGTYSVKIQADGSPDASTLTLLGPQVVAVSQNSFFFEHSTRVLNTYRADAASGKMFLLKSQDFPLGDIILTGWSNRLWFNVSGANPGVLPVIIDPVSGDAQPEQQIAIDTTQGSPVAFENGILTPTATSLDIYVLQNGGFTRVQQCTKDKFAFCDPFAGPIAVHPSGRFVFISGRDHGQRVIWTIPIVLSVGLRFEEAKKFSSGAVPAVPDINMAFSPDGGFLYTSDGVHVGGFKVAEDGSLTAVPGSPSKVPVLVDFRAFGVVEVVKH